MHLVLSAMGEQRGETFLKSGVSNYFQCDADLSGFLLIRTKSGGSRCFAEDYFDSSCRKWQVLLGGRCFWDLLRQLVTELGQSDPWTVRVPTFWPPSAAVGGKVGRDGIIWAILLVFAVVCFVHWSAACLRNWSLAWFWWKVIEGAFLGFSEEQSHRPKPLFPPSGGSGAS